MYYRISLKEVYYIHKEDTAAIIYVMTNEGLKFYDVDKFTIKSTKYLFNTPIQYFNGTTVSNEEFLKDLKTHLKVEFDVV